MRSLFYLVLTLNIFKYNSNSCLCFLTITCRIIPVTTNNKDISIPKQLTINVGNLGTKPVLKYSTTTGIPNIKQVI